MWRILAQTLNIIIGGISIDCSVTNNKSVLIIVFLVQLGLLLLHLAAKAEVRVEMLLEEEGAVEGEAAVRAAVLGGEGHQLRHGEQRARAQGGQVAADGLVHFYHQLEVFILGFVLDRGDSFFRMKGYFSHSWSATELIKLQSVCEYR